MKKTGNNAAYYAKGTSSIALSIATVNAALAVGDNPCAIAELFQYNELEIIYANIRV